MKRKKRAQLVCQHLENISRKALKEHQEVVRNYVRGRQGVYALYRKGKLYYVGLATNLRNRLKHHLVDRHGQSWDRFSVYLTIGDHHKKELESLMLRVMKPAGNKVQGKFASSEDLRRRFRQDLKQNALNAVDGIFHDKPKPRPKKRSTRKPPGVKSKNALSRYLDKPLIIKATHKGKTYRGRIRLDGQISHAGKLFASPSAAAAFAVNRVCCNGWMFWHYERAPGDWVRLNTLKK